MTDLEIGLGELLVALTALIGGIISWRRFGPERDQMRVSTQGQIIEDLVAQLEREREKTQELEQQVKDLTQRIDELSAKWEAVCCDIEQLEQKGIG